jgi:hypothetical protein
VVALNLPAASPASKRVTYGSSSTVVVGVRICQPEVPSQANEANPAAAGARRAGAVVDVVALAGAAVPAPRARTPVTPPSTPRAAVPAPVIRVRRLSARFEVVGFVMRHTLREPWGRVKESCGSGPRRF